MARRPRFRFSAQRYSSDSDSNTDPLSRSIVGELTEWTVTSFLPFDQDNLLERPATTALTFAEPTKTSYPWTRTHWDKLQTVPETNKPESKRETIEIDTNMVGGPSQLWDDPMSEETKNHEPRALRLNLPKDFSGKREDLKKFLQQVNLYMDVNAKIYKDNMMKIACVLSFMDEGDASSWKEHSSKKQHWLPPWLWHLDKFWKKN